jgi:hypothetical protein
MNIKGKQTNPTWKKEDFEVKEAEVWLMVVSYEAER